MSVDFTAKVIYGFPVSKEEFKNLTQRIDDETYDEIIDNFINIYEDSDRFFAIKEIARTEEWAEIDVPNIDELMKNEQECINKFYEMFPDRNTEKPKLYLIEEVW